MNVLQIFYGNCFLLKLQLNNLNPDTGFINTHCNIRTV